MLKTGDALTRDLGDAIERDPEVRQARTIANAARKRLVACMAGSQDGIDPAEAQRMLDAFRSATVHAEDAEDRVLMHRGLLTSVEAGRRAERRRPGATRAARPPRPDPRDRRVGRGSLARAIAGMLGLTAAGAAAVLLARWFGLKRPLTRW